jgi:NAD(P)-dependent dehydrogenase (short-subunit alcohol dehydrogenase family)
MFDLALSNVSTLISGASGGIGLTTVESFLEQDALVAAHYGSNREPLEKYAGNDKVAVVRGDVRDEKDVERMFEESRQKLGKAVEVLVGQLVHSFGRSINLASVCYTAVH